MVPEVVSRESCQGIVYTEGKIKNMKHDEKWGWKLVRTGIGLMAVSCLLMYVSFTPEMLGSNKILYYVILINLIVIEVALGYILVRKFFGKKK